MQTSTGSHLNSAVLVGLAEPVVLPSTPDVNALVTELEQLKERRTIQLAYEMGRLITARIYGSDPSGFRVKGQHYSLYRQLVTHPRIAVSAATVWRALGVYELCLKMPGILDWEPLRLGHVYAVLGLPYADQQRLLSMAAQGSMSVSALAQKASGMPKRSAAGRPRRSALARAMSPLKSFLGLARAMPQDIPIPESQRADALALLQEVGRLCEHLSVELSSPPPSVVPQSLRRPRTGDGPTTADSLARVEMTAAAASS